MTRMGLVTVMFDSPDVLPEFFQSLAAQTDQDWELEVIDNSTQDLSIVKARECVQDLGLLNVNFVRNASNVGVAKGNNQGITKCLNKGCSYIILLNNDIAFGPDVLCQIRNKLDLGEAIVAPRILYYDDNTIWYGGGKIRSIAATTSHYRDGKMVEKGDCEDHYTSYAPTCFMGIRAEVFQRVGLMDERYFVYYDDTDFVYRCLKQGFRLFYLGSSEIRHKVSSSTGGASSDFSIYYYNRNRLFFIRKHMTGFTRLIAYIWYHFTRIYVACTYNKSQTAVLKKAVRDGWRLE
jgi:GT2 family glycosyltransferase